MVEFVFWVAGYLAIGGLLTGMSIAWVTGQRVAPTSLGISLFVVGWPLVVMVGVGAFVGGCFWGKSK